MVFSLPIILEMFGFAIFQIWEYRMKVLKNACRAHENGNLRFYNYYCENLEIYSTSIICVV